MGMYDEVAFTDTCPECKAVVRGFQTKHGDQQLEVLLPWTVKRFYTSCDGCDLWIEYVDGRRTSPKWDGESWKGMGV